MTRRQRRRAAVAPHTVADAAPTTVSDGFQNIPARLGQGSGSIADASGYALTNLITRQPRNLEYMYRGSWIVKAAVDAVADDMVRQGIDFGSVLKPDAIETMVTEMEALQLWSQVGDTLRWGRLYGGAIGVILIDGQDTSTPLRADTIQKDQFKGILPVDRWCLNPTVNQVVEDFGPDLGKPKVYRIGANAPALRGNEVHYTRVIRAEGVHLPYFQRLSEQGWGLSIVEPMYDRLLAFDSSTTGAAQLVFKAYLRTLKVKGLKDILGAGKTAQAALAKNIEFIRQYQSTEGLTLIDADDEFQTHAYTFAGLDQILLQFGQQLSGATGIPLVRLFGQSPAGLNSTGESDIRNYYDTIKAKQESDLRSPLTVVLDVLHRSTFGVAPPEGFTFSFNPLWQMGEAEKAGVAKTIGDTVGAAFADGIIDKPTALKELKQASDMTGVFTNITDELIEEAALEPPLMGEGDAPDLDPGPDENAEPPPQLRSIAGGA